MIKSKLENYLKEAVKEFLPIEIFASDNEKFGHYSTNIALKLARVQVCANKEPIKIADKIVNFLNKIAPKGFFKKIEVASPGFINFWLLEKVFQDEIKEILKKQEYHKKSKIKSQKLKIQIEFISANPTGPLTVGNGRGGFLGDALANILKLQGHKVIKEYYINDAKVSTQIRELGKTAIGVGKNYKTKNLEFKIKKLIFKKIKNYGDAGNLLAKEIQKENKSFIENELKIKFDNWFSEESLYKSGVIEKLLKELEIKNLTYKKDNAIWFKAKQFGDSEDRVLVRSTGEPTYFLPDFAYHLNKFKARKFDKVINIWGADHHGYGSRLKSGLIAFNISDKKLKIIISQLVRLTKKGKEFKMSKRKGIFTTLEDLIKEVGLDATKFFFLMYSPDTHMNFDLDLAKERSLKNPVYYAQYAAVRCLGILKKAGVKHQASNIKYELLSTKEDINLMRILTRFPEIIEEAAKNYSPQILARYSLDLARQFNNFYEKERIIGLDDKNLILARLALIQATLIIFKNTFDALGISLPKKM